MDTATAEGRKKRLEEIVTGYQKTGNTVAIVRMIGGSVDDWRDENPGSHPDERINE